MASEASAYLVIRMTDGFGDVFPLNAGQRYTMGRANTNRILLRDDVCSREHAEVYFANARWHIQDLKSLNGTLINGDRLDSDWELSPGDEVHVGRTTLVFVEEFAQLPDMPLLPQAENMTIKKRLGQTRFLTPLPPLARQGEEPVEQTPTPRHTLNRDLALLYQLALEMGSATTHSQLVDTVLKGLLAAIPADAGSILTRDDHEELVVAGHLHRNPEAKGYVKVSQSLSKEVISSREAILADNVSRHPLIKNLPSIRDVGALSLICAPVIFHDRLLGLIHLYCTELGRELDAEDLEFVLAVATQFGAASHQLQRQESLTAENQLLRDQLRLESELVGKSAAIKKVEQKIALVAGTRATVLVRGESGTGKELVARAIHYSSPRREGPFVCLNCAALPESLLESELFGHEKGAFTGATEKKIGKFEAADSGTLFLDEIGELSPAMQAKLLRILEGHPFERVGGFTPIRVDVRVVAATNQPLEQAIAAGRFRRDLFFRLQVVEITVPPLREHRDDIPLLVDHFFKRFVRETGRRIQNFTPAAMTKMEAHDWPGNIRELRNVVERAVALSTRSTLDVADVWLSSAESDGTVVDAKAPVAPYQPLSLEDVEKHHILGTLRHTEWNKSQAAAILQIERSTLDRKIKLYELKR